MVIGLDEGVGKIAWEDGFLVELYDDGFAGQPEGIEEGGQENFRVEVMGLAVESH